MYSLVVALVLIAISCYLAALRQGRWYHWLAYVVATTAAFYVHLIAALLIPVQALIFALALGPPCPLETVAFKPGRLDPAYLPLLAWQLPALLQVVDTGYRFFPLNEMLLSLLADYSLAWHRR